MCRIFLIFFLLLDISIGQLKREIISHASWFWRNALDREEPGVH